MAKKKLSLCTVYKENYPTLQMFTSAGLLEQYFDVQRIWIKSIFRKGNNDKRVGFDQEEIAARNQYLDYVPDDDWMLILDSDEIIWGDLNLLPAILDQLEKNEVRVAWIPEAMPGQLNTQNFGTSVAWYPLLRGRLVRKIEGMEYADFHDRLWDGEENVFSEQYKHRATLNLFGIMHYNTPLRVEVKAPGSIEFQEIKLNDDR